jgi:Flp pilus assembly protein TadD
MSSAAQAENLDSFLEQSGLYRDVRPELLEAASRRWNNNTVLLTNAGIIKMRAGKFDEAEQLFKRLQSIKPDSRVTLATLAQIELIKGNRNAAEQYLRKALKHYPNDPDLRQNLDAVLNAR